MALVHPTQPRGSAPHIMITCAKNSAGSEHEFQPTEFKNLTSLNNIHYQCLVKKQKRFRIILRKKYLFSVHDKFMETELDLDHSRSVNWDALVIHHIIADVSLYDFICLSE